MGGIRLGGGDTTTFARERGFFGVLEVEREADGFHVLRHSGINHGVQSCAREGSRAEESPPEPRLSASRAGGGGAGVRP